MHRKDFIVDPSARILITGSNGFIGSRLVDCLLSNNFKNLRCLVRPSGDKNRLLNVVQKYHETPVEICEGNLLSVADCDRISKDIEIIYHLAAGIDKSFAGAFMNSVVATRNLLDSVIKAKTVKRFVNISSFAVYSNLEMNRNSMLDENCKVDDYPEKRYEAYTYGKYKQDLLVTEYGKKYGLPYVIVRPSVVFGPGKRFIPSRVGIDTFGFFIHIGGPIKIPLTYVDNCAEAIALCGFVDKIDGEVFNVVDDDLPTSRNFLSLYKKNVRSIFSVYMPYPIFNLFSFFWESYSKWSKGQLPPVFSRRRCQIYWKGNRYSNQKLKRLVGWKPKVKMDEALAKYFEYQCEARRN